MFGSLSGLITPMHKALLDAYSSSPEKMVSANTSKRIPQRINRVQTTLPPDTSIEASPEPITEQTAADIYRDENRTTLQEQPDKLTPDASSAPSADGEEFVFRSSDDISLKIKHNEWQHLKGFLIIVVNHRLTAIGKVKLTVYSAQSFDSSHNEYRDGSGFKAYTKTDSDVIHPSCSGKTPWLVQRTEAMIF